MLLAWNPGHTEDIAPEYPLIGDLTDAGFSYTSADMSGSLIDTQSGSLLRTIFIGNHGASVSQALMPEINPNVSKIREGMKNKTKIGTGRSDIVNPTRESSRFAGMAIKRCAGWNAAIRSREEDRFQLSQGHIAIALRSGLRIFGSFGTISPMCGNRRGPKFLFPS